MIEIKDAANAPWHEVQRVFNMMQSFEIRAGGRLFLGPVTLELDDSRHLTVKVDRLPPYPTDTDKAKPAAKAKKKLSARPVGRPWSAKRKR